MTDDTTTAAGGRPPTIFELCQTVYAAAASRGIDALTIDECELWQVGGMLKGEESEEEKRRREDAEVFQERLAADEAGVDYDPDLVPFNPAQVRGRLARPTMPPPGVN